MTSLKDKVQNALDESRMLVLGVQVLLGFQFQAILEKAFDQMPIPLQYAKIGALSLMLLTIVLLMSTAPHHHISARGEDTEELNSFVSHVTGAALLPFALGLGIDVCISTHKILGTAYSILFGIAIMGLALFYWYGLEAMHKLHHAPSTKEQNDMADENKPESSQEQTKLNDKVRHALTEARMVLPGAQALLGFQFIGMMKEGFDKLPASSQHLHLVSLALIAFSTILLMAPAAYHRLVEKGEATEHFYHFASHMVLGAMVPLALGICLDFYIVVRKVTASPAFAIAATVVMLCLFFGFWFGYAYYLRNQQEHQSEKPEMAPGKYATS
ncbi:MAG: hypothetical protein JO316_10085 [Abitibacteriaceae bacterium]|nr:hypothetical protein [Abditibacteriaceae bacterium]